MERNRLLLGAVQESDAAEENKLSANSKPDITGILRFYFP